MKHRPFILLALAVCLWPGAAWADPITGAIVAILGGSAVFGAGATLGGAIAAAAVTLGQAAIGAILTTGITIGLSSLLSRNKQPATPSFSFADSASNRSQIVRSAIDSHKVIYGQARVSGALVYITTTDLTGGRAGKNELLHMVIALAGHECESIEKIYLNEDEITLDADGFVTTEKYVVVRPLVRIKKHLGAADQAADPDLIAEVPEWTDAHRLRGICYVYVRLNYQGSSWPTGIPNVSAIVKGKKLYDPRTTTTAWSDNWALCVRDYIANADYGLGATSAEIDDVTFMAAANVADELVTLKDGTTTQKRYTCNGVVDTADKPIDIIKDLTSAGAGVMPYAQGQYKLYAGAYNIPTVTIDKSWLAGPMEVSARTSRNEIFNAVRGVYVDPNKQWQPTDFPVVKNDTYRAEDGGYLIERDIELAYTTHVEAAQRIAKIILEKSRQGIVVKMPCNYKALQLSIWDTVLVTNDLVGWDEKVFRVTMWELNPQGGVFLTLQEDTSASYDWNAGEATTYDPAPDTNLPSAWAVTAPGNPVVVESLYETIGSSGIKSKLDVSWAESENSFIAYYVLEYKLTSDTNYTVTGQYSGTNTTIFDLAPGQYEFRVKAYNTLNIGSDYASSTYEVVGLSAPPADITGFTLNAIHNQAHLQWAQPTDLDVRVGGTIRVRWTPETTGADWAQGLDLGPALSGISTNAVVPLVNGTYMVKAVDSSGNESTNAATVISTVANVVAMNVVITGNQHPSFAGSATGMYVDGSDDTLRLDEGGLFDSESGNFDSASGNFDDAGGATPTTSGSYTFANGGNNYFDLGAVYTSRVTLALNSTNFKRNDLFESATGNFDDRSGLFDGDQVGGITLTPYVRTTEDDPSGTPTWSAWRQFVVGDFVARAYQFKIDVESADQSISVAISELGVSIDVPDREERFISQSLASGGTAITYAKPFFAKPLIGANIQSAVSGDTLKVTHTTNGSGYYSSATLQVLNGGSGVARTVDAYVKGY